MAFFTALVSHTAWYHGIPPRGLQVIGKLVEHTLLLSKERAVASHALATPITPTLACKQSVALWSGSIFHSHLP